MTALQLDIGLIACSRTKADRPVPARELYLSPLFRATRQYAENRYGPGQWLAEIAGVTDKNGGAPTALTISGGAARAPVTVPGVTAFAWAPR